MGKFVLRVRPDKEMTQVPTVLQNIEGIYIRLYTNYGEVFLGIVLEVREGQCPVQCLKLSSGRLLL